MNIELPPDLEEFVSKQVREGKFSTSTEAVVGALEVMRDRETLESERDQRRREILEMIDAGLEQIEKGEIGSLDIEQIKAEGRRRLAAKRQAN